ncbi:MAG: response regulator transcription factor, partial [Pseudomonadota bacterium]
RELVARIQNIFKRGKSTKAGTIYQFGTFSLDVPRKRLTNNGQEVAVTAAEFSLLSLLIENQDRVLSRDEIMQSLRGIDADIFSRAIDVLISRLRQKLEKAELIRTVRGQGYQFVNR